MPAESDVVDRFQALPHTLGLPTKVPDPARVAPEELDRATDTAAHLRHVDHVFARVFGRPEADTSPS